MNAPVSYYDRGKPVHELSYCAFLDVLGFSDAIVQTTKNKTHDKLLERFHQIFREQLEWFRSQTDDGLLFFKTFSGNVLLAFPAGSWDMESEFGIVVEALARYQLAMARSGFLCAAASPWAHCFWMKTRSLAKRCSTRTRWKARSRSIPSWSSPMRR